MKLITYLSRLSAAQQAQFAEECGTTVEYLQHLSRGHSKCGFSSAVAINHTTKGKVTYEDLRPDLFRQAKQRSKKLTSHLKLVWATESA